jgi:hypothetical protein
MEIDFKFNGIHTTDGQYPRVKVVGSVDLNEPRLQGLAIPTIEITLPITSHLGLSYLEVAAAALETARQLVRTPALESWLEAHCQAPGG